MRFYKNVGCYYGREPERRQKALDQMLRQPGPNPEGGEFAKTTTSTYGTVRDPYLRGKTENAFSPAHDVKKK